MKNNSASKKMIWLIILLIAVILGLKFYWNSLLSAPDPKNTGTSLFVISPGESTSSVVEKLNKEGLIKSTWAFNVFLKRTSQAGNIQAGDFKLSPSMSAQKILQELTSGKVDHWVTLLEGWRVEEMAEELNSKFKIQNQKFLEVAKEGYMFPDTYLFHPDVTASDVAQTMRDNFSKKYDQGLQGKIKRLGLSPDQGVVLASIVEREARSDEARKMVASILLKRLNIGMGLNADATIQYALVKKGVLSLPPDGWWKSHLTHDDLKIASLYNTYLHQGLPPAPISNPGLSSLQAVANADPGTPYLYYYHDSQGNSHYAKTLEEHNENIANYP